MTIGTIRVTVVEARKLSNKDGILGKNDPYVVLKVGSNKQKTPVASNAGSKATWDMTFDFSISNDKESLEVEVTDFDNVTTNDLIGKNKISLAAVCSTRLIECWYPLRKHDEFQGEINLIIEFFPAGAAPHADVHHGVLPPQSAYPPQQGYPQQGYPPQQAYPPQQGYPQQVYPPQQGHPQQAYPPQQGYPPQQAYPPQNPTYPPY